MYPDVASKSVDLVVSDYKILGCCRLPLQNTSGHPGMALFWLLPKTTGLDHSEFDIIPTRWAHKPVIRGVIFGPQTK